MQPVPDLPSQQIAEQSVKTLQSLAPLPFVDRSFQAAGFVRLKIGQIGQPSESVSAEVNGAGLYSPGIQLVITETPEIAYDLAAQEVLGLFRQSGARGLGTATGGTMAPIWERILKSIPEGTDLSELFTVGLDEYVGIPPESPQSYHYEMRQRLAPLERFAFNLNNTHLPVTWDSSQKQPKTPEQLVAECQRYDQFVVNHAPDLQLLGIGSNAHIGFNEPGSDPREGTHLVNLATSTRVDNAVHFGGDLDSVPRQAATMGLGTLEAMAQRGTRLLLIATGRSKANAIHDTLFGPISSNVPSSSLRQWGATAIVDIAAAGPLGKELWFRGSGIIG